MAQRQFRPTDTSLWVDRYGNGSDGALTVSGNANVNFDYKSACTGTSGTTSLSATNTNFAAGQIILIHQTQGTNAGQWELNKIASYTAGTITTSYGLINSYTTGAQVIRVPQYTDVTVNSGITLTCNSWDGSVGGVVVLMATGTVTITGTIAANGGTPLAGGSFETGASSGAGFRGGSGFFDANQDQGQRDTFSGEGNVTGSTNGGGPNGNAGGAGYNHWAGSYDASGGGGGGHFASGSNGQPRNGGGINPNVGVGGSSVGDTTLTTIFLGGGGGAGGARPTNGNNGGGGGQGGGIIMIFGKTVTVTGSLSANGGAGGSNGQAGGGGGAGGSIFIAGQVIDIGTNKLTATAGAGTSNAGSGGGGGAGSKGRAYVAYSGSFTGSASSPDLNTEVNATLAELPALDSYSFLM